MPAMELRFSVLTPDFMLVQSGMLKLERQLQSSFLIT